MNTNTIHMISQLNALGLSTTEALQLRRIAMTLHRWYEQECGSSNDYASWSIERDELTNKPYLCTYPHNGKSSRSPIPDREAGAHRRLAKLMSAHPDLTYYCQTDPRGPSLYILRTQDIDDQDIQQVYTRGITIHK